jgi:formamidopyrimidine-DNA glycosylase
MPEGPEVWFLHVCINKYYEYNKCESYGKHLFICNENRNLSFGLTGKIKINDDKTISKVNTGWIYGDDEVYNDIDDIKNKLGVDWLTSDKLLLDKEINLWKKSKKSLASLLLDQSKISGIGVAWGSEVLYRANLHPNIKANEQNLENLVEHLISLREEIKLTYLSLLENTNINTKDIINEWFLNLYEIRQMQVYKKGNPIKISGRKWWIK